MKKMLIALTIVFAAASSCPAGTVTVAYRFDAPVITEENGFSSILFPGTVQSAGPGKPSCPYRAVRILLPRGETVSRVEVSRRGWTPVPGKIRLMPKQRHVPGVEGGLSEGPLLIDMDAYGVDIWIEPPVPVLRTQYMRGHAIATGTICPVEYNAAREQAGYHSEIIVTVHTSTGRATGMPERHDPVTLDRLGEMIDNPVSMPLLTAPFSSPLSYAVPTTRWVCCSSLA